MKKYDHLFFDLDNTLWDFDANSRQAMKETLDFMGIATQDSSFDDFFVLYEEINDALWKQYQQKKISKTKLTTERFSRSMATLNTGNWEPEAINNLYLEKMALQTKLVSGCRETLDWLKSKGYHLHLITNGFDEVQRKKMINSQLNHFFESIFTSEIIQSNKPDREIFEHAIKSANAKKAKSVMIGDNWETDILGAANFGIDAILVKGERPAAIPADYQKNMEPAGLFQSIFIRKAKITVVEKITDLNFIL